MADHAPIVLTAKDYSLLQTLLEEAAPSFETIAVLLRRKLHDARIVFENDIDTDVVTLNSRVRYRVNGHRIEERTLVAHASQEILGLTLLLGTPRGVAMIGMSAGQSCAIPRGDGSVETLQIEAVLYQPEAIRRSDPIATLIEEARPKAAPPNAVSMLSTYRLGRNVARVTDDGNDPGPSAA